VAAVIAAVVVLAVVGYLYHILEGDDDRPPVVVNNGSVIFNGGDPGDPDTVKINWHDWKQDSGGSQWKPDFPGGFNVDHYEVTVTKAGQVCTSAKGDTVAIAYTVDGGNPPPPAATFTILISSGGRREPKVDPGGLTMTPTSLVTGPNGVNTVPAKLTYSTNGYISNVTVSSSGTPTGSCQFTSRADTPVITAQPRKNP
jgi:hypothetical protein